MMNRVLNQLRDTGINPRLNIFGVVMTMFDGRTKLSNEVVGEVRNLLGGAFLKPSFRAARGSPKLRVRQTDYLLRQIQLRGGGL